MFCRGRYNAEKGREMGATYVDLDVEVLQVERVLPDIDADDGDKRQERVLVRGRRELEALRRRVVSLFQSLSRPYKNGKEDEDNARASPSQSPGCPRWWC